MSREKRLEEIIDNVPNCLAITTHYQWDKVKKDIIQALLVHEEERMKPIREALKNLTHEMEYMLKVNPHKRGGLYEKRLNEAKQAIKAVCE